MNGSELIAVWKEGAGLQYWQTSYGRYQPTQGTYTSYYYVNDHLGNVRVVLSETGQRVDATDYYAFGMALPQRRYDGGTKEQYSGKERDKDTNWDYFGARYYNPSIGRFNGIDRFADKYPYFTPFQYAGNNPMNFTDVNGDSLKVTALQAQNPEMLDRILSELTLITGVQYAVNSTGMVVEVANSDGLNPVTIGNPSETARKFIAELISSDHFIGVRENSPSEYRAGKGNRGGIDSEGKGFLILNDIQMSRSETAAEGVHFMTLGYGMITIHELSHSVGHKHSEQTKTTGSITGDFAVELENTIRKEMGSIFGQRLSYTSQNGIVSFSNGSVDLSTDKKAPSFLQKIRFNQNGVQY